MEDDQKEFVHCSWNRCQEVFTRSHDLVRHLEDQHFNAIFAVRKDEWDTYLRSTEGTSGSTDGPLAAVAHTNFSSRASNQSHLNQPSSMMSQKQHPPRQHPPLPLPVSPSSTGWSNFASTDTPVITPVTSPRSSSRQDTPLSHPSSPFPEYYLGRDTPSDLPSTPARPLQSFSGVAAQSSPVQTPNVAAIPPSPSLSNMVADAINTASQANARPRSLAHDKSSIGETTPARLPLPRGFGKSRTRHEHSRSIESTSTGTSARDVETQLTRELPASPVPQGRAGPRTRSQSRTQSQLVSQGGRSQAGYSRLDLQTQAAYASQQTVHEEINSFLSQTQNSQTILDSQVPSPSFRSGTLRIRSSGSSGQNAAPASKSEERRDPPDRNSQRSYDPSDPAAYNDGRSVMYLQTQAPYPSQSQWQ